MCLKDIINIENFCVISNPSQRVGNGGRPALMINTNKFFVRNITNSVIQIPWGIEAVWAVLTPKNIQNNSMVKKIAVCAFYCKPNIKSNPAFIDHISEVYNIVSAKFDTGLHFILAGDINEVKFEKILHLSPKLKQLVTKPTRLNPPSMLDPIITSLGAFYQNPECVQPLDADPNTNGKPSDHLIVIMRPLDRLNRQTARKYRKVTVRPMIESGLNKLKSWCKAQTWSEVLLEPCTSKKAKVLQEMVLQKVNEVLPLKTRKNADDYQPWFTESLKIIDRKKKREFKKNRRSPKYYTLLKSFKKGVAKAKKAFIK